MPTYEYQCPEGHEFELIPEDEREAPRQVSGVRENSPTRQISGGAGLVFKGSGFYITDYGKDGKGPRNDPSEKSDSGGSKEAKPAAESKADTSSKSEAKPAAKPEAKSGKHPPSKSHGKAAPE